MATEYIRAIANPLSTIPPAARESMSAVRHAYCHVPFCRHRCGYCDFSLVAGRNDLVERYLRALRCELERLSRPLDLETLYFGGGTPSHLGLQDLQRLFDLVVASCRPLAGAEMTVEANPLDVTADWVAAVEPAGVTRVSLGGQSLNAATLASLDRDHAPDDVRRATCCSPPG